MRKFRILLLPIILLACNNEGSDKDSSIDPVSNGIPPPQNLSYTILAQHPHDTSAYTQGLEIFKGKLFESTGDYQNSSLRITDYKTGSVEKKHVMGTEKIFGEGITIFNNKIYQLTWQSNIVYVYDAGNIEKPVATFKWPYEGWGITHDSSSLIISDGSANLYFVNPLDFSVKSTIRVTDNKGPVNEINELEYINGSVYANVYLTNDIIRIDPKNGHVTGKMTLDNLLQRNEFIPNRTDVLNGIAYDSTSNTILITGKRWPKLFELKIN
jgi:glutamine cyclotransferase